MKRPPLPDLDDASQRLLDRHLDHLRNRHLAPVYIDQRRRALTCLVAWLRRLLVDIALADLDRWQTEALVARTTGRSRKTLVSHVREFYRWCHDVEEATSDDRGRRLVPARQARLVPRPTSDRALVEAGHGTRPPATHAVPRGVPGPARLEIAGLRREDVLDDADLPTIIVRGKGNRERVLPLVAPVLAEL